MNNLKEKHNAMTAMIEDWQSRGKSKKQYCLENEINEAKFYYWYSRMRRKEDTPLDLFQ
ncbi:IS66 family insertion sequence element accessory protein TnpA [Pedobacter alluvionis]|uniref:IS66 family insertion sequence element accessory protein TnpA n=1 Tax=Pedobacter alluvionis TaxID=475253 RepID=UPI003744AC62